MTGVFARRRNLDRDTHTQRMPCENEGRDQSDAGEAKECQREAVNH